MQCINCEFSKFINDENGKPDLFCLKKNIAIFGFNKCVSTSKFVEEEKIVKFYLANYETMKIIDIAHKIGWTPNKLHYFIEAKMLPRKIFSRKGIKYKKDTKELNND